MPQGPLLLAKAPVPRKHLSGPWGFCHYLPLRC